MSNESDADVVAALWAEYKSNGTVDARERLILNYAPLVKFVAGRVASGLPQSVDQSDLVSYGIFGLIDAIDKFEPERGWKFETYAISRIKGAIIDELRAAGTAVVFVSHHLDEVLRIADRVVVLRDGRRTGELRRGECDREIGRAHV